MDEDILDLSAWPEALDRDAVIPCLQAFRDVVADMDNVELIITSDFEAQVRARMEPDYAAVYAQDRGAYGSAMAKTLAKPDGGHAVVFDVRLFLKGAGSPEATFRHEALHVLLVGQAGETTFDIRHRLSVPSGIHPDIVAMAGIAVEEYRVQRTVFERFPKDSWSSFAALCAACHDAIHEAAVAYYFDLLKDSQPIRDVVIRAFAAMTTQAGYVAAQLDVAGFQTPRLDDPDLHERMLGEPWGQVIAALRRLPAADQRVDRTALETAVLEVAGELDNWLAQVGFGARVLGDGRHYFHVYEHQDWVTREPVGADEPAIR